MAVGAASAGGRADGCVTGVDMNRRRKVFGVSGAVLAVSMLVPAGGGRADELATFPRDPHSFADPRSVRVVRVDLDLDFTAKALRGVATLNVVRGFRVGDDVPLVLDTSGLVIESVTTTVGAAVPFRLGENDPIKGRALSIQLPLRTETVKVAYRTSPGVGPSALQWLDPPGTAGKKQPFLFTQSEPILARTWIPLQDSPAVRVTYGATVRVPPGLTAVMSADRVAKAGDPPGVFRFEMPQEVPSYLIALAVGDLAFRPLGPRTGVYAEPPVVDAAAREFADTEAMVAAVEKRFGPYRWGRYDILVLPPSFPFGGMENPKLTFATPTVLAGDKSLVSLVAHELAHSWSGNLVTNATWRDFWLNEGVTTYIERRIVEDLYGPERAAMERALGYGELRNELKTLAPRDQFLHINLDGRDPDEGMTRVPYEKGALFLTSLEQAAGRPKFDAFLKSYFDEFEFDSITTGDFREWLKVHLLTGDPDASVKVDLDAWLEKPGLPADAPEPKSDRFGKVEAAANDFARGAVAAGAIDTSKWTTQEWVHFLRSLPGPLSSEQMAALDRAFKLTDRGNAEVAQQWLVLTVRNRYAPADARLDNFLTTIGRRKFLMPLYEALLKTPGGAAKARAIFARARPFYHPIAAESVDKLIARSSPK